MIFLSMDHLYSVLKKNMDILEPNFQDQKKLQTEKNQEKVVISNKKRMEIPSVVFLLMSRAVIFPQLKHPVFGIIP